MTAAPVVVALAASDAVVEFLAAGGVEVVTLPRLERPVDDMAADLRRTHVDRIAGVVAVSDETVAHAALLNAALGTPGTSPASVALAGDKLAMRSRLAEAGASTIRWAPVASESDVRAVVDELGPVIVKPSEGSASRHVFRVGAAADAVMDALGPLLSRESGWIAEEFLDGPEISVESLSWAGRHDVLAITAKETGPGFVELGHRVPAALPNHLAAEVCTLVAQVLDTLGLDHVVSHTELILTASGPRLVETHPRIGGDRIGRLVELVTGRHPLTSLAHALSGRAPKRQAHDRGSGPGAAAIAFLVAPPGTITAVRGADVAARSRGVVETRLSAVVGDTVGPLTSSADRCGHVIAVARESGEAADLARAAADVIRIETVPAG